MRATIVVFENETHITVFDKNGGVGNRILPHDNASYTQAFAAVPKTVMDMGGEITATYSELNEFGQPVNCFFVNFPNR